MRITIEKKIPQILKDSVILELQQKPYFKEYFVRNNLSQQFASIEQHGKIFVLRKEHQPVAFVSVYYVDDLFFGQKGVYTPEWANYLSLNIGDNMVLFAALYNDMKQHGYTHHVLSNTMSKMDLQLLDFAYSCILKDGARAIVETYETTLTLENVTNSTIEDYLKMCKEHEDYMSSSPIFLGDGYHEQEARDKIAHDNNVYYILNNGDKIGFTTLSTTEKAGSELLKTPTSIALKGTHIVSTYQNQGFGGELIKAVSNFAKEHDYSYIVTDFETYNIKAHMFWPKHFDIVMKSYLRYIG